MEPVCSGAMQQQGLKRDLRLLALLCGPSHSAGLRKENTSLQKGQEQPPSSPPSLSRPTLQVLLPTVVLLFLLAVAGSAGLIHALRRRRKRSKEGNGTEAQLGVPAQQGQGTIPALPSLIKTLLPDSSPTETPGIDEKLPAVLSSSAGTAAPSGKCTSTPWSHSTPNVPCSSRLLRLHRGRAESGGDTSGALTHTAARCWTGCWGQTTASHQRPRSPQTAPNHRAERHLRQ